MHESNLKQGFEMTKKNISWIDSLKGIAMCGVIMIHSGGAELPSILGRVGSIGKNGVQIFFFLSAYLTFVSLERIFGDHSRTYKKRICYKNILVWWKKKFIKLIPMYYLMIIICSIFEGGSSYWLGSEGHISFFNVLSHVFFVHGLFPHYTDSIIAVEWYLGVLAIFYLLAPVLYKAINSLEKAIVGFFLSLPLCYMIKEIAYNYVPLVEDSYIYTTYIDTFSLIAQLPVMLLGIIMFFVMQGFDIQKIKYRKLISYGLFGFAIMMIFGQAYQENSLYMFSGDTLFGIWFLCIAISLNIWIIPVVDNKVFRIIGKYSYPIYLIHYFLIHVLQRVWKLNIANKILNWGIQYISILFISLIISYVLEKYYNGPVVHWLEKYLITDKE